MFKLQFETDNSAFDDGAATEVARILRAIADRVEDGNFEGFATDNNGNSVGKFRLNGD